jgi:hypothetical protein
MTEILALLQNIAPVVSATILQQMSQVIYGMLISCEPTVHRLRSAASALLTLLAVRSDIQT